MSSVSQLSEMERDAGQAVRGYSSEGMEVRAGFRQELITKR